MRDLRLLPKAHLHVHLEGAMRPATLAELCERDGIDLPVIDGYGSFGHFNATYAAACDVLRSWGDLERLVFEVVEDAALAGAVWVEPGFTPLHHRGKLGTDAEILDGVLAAGHAAAARLGIGFGLMVAADRTLPVADGEELATLAAERAGAGVVAFGLHNDETDWPPEPFERAYAIAREAGLLSTPHAGELGGPESVRGALDVLGAQRLLHGVRAVEDPELVVRLAAEQICLDVCPTSNVQLAVVASIAEHPLPALLDAGVHCSLNGDDPLLFGPGLAEEYELVRTQMGFDDERIAFLARCSIQHSGATDAQKSAGIAGVAAWLR